MAASGATRYRWDDIPKEQLKPDLHRRLITAERMMLAHVYLDQGCVVPKHSHENEQLTYILEGTLRFWLGDDEPRWWTSTPARCSTSRRMSRTGPRRSRTRSTWTSSARREPTGSTARTRICAANGASAGPGG